MTDWMYAGATWRRTVAISDANGPVDLAAAYEARTAKYV